MEVAGGVPSEGVPPEAVAARPETAALPVARKAGWLEMKVTIGWARRFVRVEQGSLCRWHDDVTLSLSDALKSRGLAKFEPQLAEIGVATVPAMSALDCAGADAARLAEVGMEAAELARLAQLAQQWRKSIATFRRIDLRSCSLQELDGRRFSLTTPDGGVFSMRGSVPGDTALWVSAVRAELAELEVGASARQSVSQMDSDVGGLLELLTADDDSQADTAAQLQQLQSVVGKADCDLSEQMVNWLAQRLQVDSTPVKLKTLNLICALASTDAPSFCRALSRPATSPDERPPTVISGVMLAVKYEVEPHPQYGDKPQQLVRAAAKKCADRLESTAALHTPKKPSSSSKPGFFSKMSPVVSLALSESVSAARNLFESTDAAEERELQRLEDLIGSSSKPLFAGDRVRYSEGRLEGVIQSISTLNDGRVTCKVRIDDDESNVSSDAEAGEAGQQSEGIIRTYFLQDLHPIPKTLWEPRGAHIKSLTKKAKSGHVSLGLEAGTLSLNSRELCFATDDGWTTTSLPWHAVKGGAAGVAINHKAVDIPASSLPPPGPQAAQAAEPEPEPEQDPEPSLDTAAPDAKAGGGIGTAAAEVAVLKTVVVLCINRAICPRGKLEILMPEQQAAEFERVSKAAAAEAAEWCAKLVAEDDAKKQDALALAGLATNAANTPSCPEAVANENTVPTSAADSEAPVDGSAAQASDSVIPAVAADGAAVVTA